jgi:hypothetical protein
MAAASAAAALVLVVSALCLCCGYKLLPALRFVHGPDCHEFIPVMSVCAIAYMQMKVFACVFKYVCMYSFVVFIGS